MASFVTFKDGHKEEIFYFKKYNNGGLLFATTSGMYGFRRHHSISSVCGFGPQNQFIKLGMEGPTPIVTAEEIFDIDSVTIDTRIKVAYALTDREDGDLLNEGYVLVSPNATDDQIKLAIIDDLGSLEIEKMED